MPQTKVTMTDQEAEVFAARLTRIWTPKIFGFTVSYERGSNATGAEWECLSSDFTYDALLEDELKLEVVFGAAWQDASEYFEISRDSVSLLCEDGQLSSSSGAHYEVQENVFSQRWLPFFRRKCWLSGCDIEATAHEKAEWMQGFTREEIQAWNLTI